MDKSPLNKIVDSGANIFGASTMKNNPEMLPPRQFLLMLNHPNGSTFGIEIVGDGYVVTGNMKPDDALELLSSVTQPSVRALGRGDEPTREKICAAINEGWINGGLPQIRDNILALLTTGEKGGSE